MALGLWEFPTDWQITHVKQLGGRTVRHLKACKLKARFNYPSMITSLQLTFYLLHENFIALGRLEMCLTSISCWCVFVTWHVFFCIFVTALVLQTQGKFPATWMIQLDWILEYLNTWIAPIFLPFSYFLFGLVNSMWFCIFMFLSDFE